jgi:hypothetical protein
MSNASEREGRGEGGQMERERGGGREGGREREREKRERDRREKGSKRREHSYTIQGEEGMRMQSTVDRGRYETPGISYMYMLLER